MFKSPFNEDTCEMMEDFEDMYEQYTQETDLISVLENKYESNNSGK